RGDPAEGGEERLLRDVLGVVAVAHHPVAEGEYDPLKPLDQEPRRVRIAGQERLDQRTVVHRPFAFRPRSAPARLNRDTPARGRPFRKKSVVGAWWLVVARVGCRPLALCPSSLARGDPKSGISNPLQPPTTHHQPLSPPAAGP